MSSFTGSQDVPDDRQVSPRAFYSNINTPQHPHFPFPNPKLFTTCLQTIFAFLSLPLFHAFFTQIRYHLSSCHICCSFFFCVFLTVSCSSRKGGLYPHIYLILIFHDLFLCFPFSMTSSMIIIVTCNLSFPWVPEALFERRCQQWKEPCSLRVLYLALQKCRRNSHKTFKYG